MSGAGAGACAGSVSVETPRAARPLSGGLRGLWGWLRREREGRSSDDDSVCSDSSARTAASFAFLPPHAYRLAAAPLQLPPPDPPTDSYKRRVRDRNQRRHHDRDLTLHRKYRLPLGEAAAYDAFSLPIVRRGASAEARLERERRATSESFPRPVAHVPGKRRAPPPPGAPQRTTSLPPTSSLARRRARKRPAPPPPFLYNVPTESNVVDAKIQGDEKENSKPAMNQNINIQHLLKEENRYQKEDRKVAKPTPRQERSFFRQIFDSRKRNSAIDVPPVRLLPSISELDRQAAEIIHAYKAQVLEQNNNNIDAIGESTMEENTWICTRCLKKYDERVNQCTRCSTYEECLGGGLKKDYNLLKFPNSSPSTSKESTEKHKLREMLKEMKDSLPKRPKPDKCKKAKDSRPVSEYETPTLRIGSTIMEDLNYEEAHSTSVKKADVTLNLKPTTTHITNEKEKNCKLDSKSSQATERVVITETKTLFDSVVVFQRDNTVNDKRSSPSMQTKPKDSNGVQNDSNAQRNLSNVDNIGRFQPLKISSLLNPIYIPKKSFDDKHEPQNKGTVQSSIQNITQNKVTSIKKTAQDSQQTSPSLRVAANVTDPISENVILPKKPLVETKTKNEFGRHSSANETKFAQKSSNEPTPTNSKISILASTSKSRTDVENKTAPEIVKDQLLKELSQHSQIRDLVNQKTDVENKKSPKIDKDQLLEVSQHSQRRNLINQLERSISEGDERAAAEAARKLAQLKLACSVLSFSSQIISEPNPSTSSVRNETPVTIKETSVQPYAKVDSATQSSPSVSLLQCSNLSKGSSVSQLTKTKNFGIEFDLSAKSASESKAHAVPLPRPEQKPSTSKEAKAEKEVGIEVWVEDREAARGPVQLPLGGATSLGALRARAEAVLGLPAPMQRWIVGRRLCLDDGAALTDIAGLALDKPFYLCLVESEPRKVQTLDTSNASVNPKSEAIQQKLQAVDITKEAKNEYSELVQLELRAVVPNAEPFECSVCMEQCAARAGVVLRECVHAFCRECVTAAVRHCEEPGVSCLATGCPGVLQEREIRGVVSPEEYERWLARGLALAESGAREAFHCRTADCGGWALCEPGVQRFPCDTCRRVNCVPCQAIHEGETCEQYRTKQRDAANAAAADALAGTSDAGTQALIDSLVRRGEALPCPECSTLITKKWGCDWIRCAACKTEICWITRSRRWGPAGRGDTSAGCRCGVDGKRCHPDCSYCH